MTHDDIDSNDDLAPSASRLPSSASAEVYAAFNLTDVEEGEARAFKCDLVGQFQKNK